MAKLILLNDDNEVIMTREGDINPSDVIIRSDYIASKLWNRADVENVLEEENFPGTSKNIDEVINTGLLDSLNDCTDQDWDIVKNAVWACDQDNLLDKEPTTVTGLVRDDEHVREFYFPEDPYFKFSFIMPGGTTEDDDRADIAGAIEETLHRLLDAGADSDKIKEQLGMFYSDGEDFEGLEEYPDAHFVDLGYFLPYAIQLLSA